MKHIEYFKFYIIAVFIIVLAIFFSTEKVNAGLFINLFRTVEYNKHTYILHTSSEHFIHDPDCKCGKEKK